MQLFSILWRYYSNIFQHLLIQRVNVLFKCYFTDLFFSLMILRVPYEPWFLHLLYRGLRYGFIFMYLSVDLVMMMLSVLDIILIFTTGKYLRDYMFKCCIICNDFYILFLEFPFLYMLKHLFSMTINCCFSIFIFLSLCIILC